MEFQIWGKLDEDGKIQAVQSSCSSSLEPCQAGCLVPRTSPGAGGWDASRWGEPVETELLSVEEKKQLVYKLDSKIDEMSCMMVRLGDLTKTLNYQEKLIQEYEERMRRQEQDIHALRSENLFLRQHKPSADGGKHFPASTQSFATRQPSSSSMSSSLRTTSSSVDVTSNTSRKSVRTSVIEMTCSVKCTSDKEETNVKYSSWPALNAQGILNGHKERSAVSIGDLASGVDSLVDIHQQNARQDANMTKVSGDNTDGDADHVFNEDEDDNQSDNNERESVTSKVARDLESTENSGAQKDIPDTTEQLLDRVSASNNDILRNRNDANTALDTVDGVFVDVTDNGRNTCTSLQNNSDKGTRKRPKVAPKPPHVSKKFTESTSETKTTPSANRPTPRPRPSMTDQPEVDRNGYLKLDCNTTHSDEDVHGTWLSVNQKLIRRRKPPTTDDEEPLDELDGPASPCNSEVTSEVQIRFSYDQVQSRTKLQRRAISDDGYNYILDDQVKQDDPPPTLPARPKTLTGLCKDVPNERRPMKRDTAATEKRKDDTFNSVMKTMRTTREWDTARKTLMEKSTSCTKDMVERTLTRLVQDLCNTMTLLKHNKAAPLSSRKFAKLRQELKNSHDGEIMTEEFLKKFSDLYIAR